MQGPVVSPKSYPHDESSNSTSALHLVKSKWKPECENEQHSDYKL